MLFFGVLATAMVFLFLLEMSEDCQGCQNIIFKFKHFQFFICSQQKLQDLVLHCFDVFPNICPECPTFPTKIRILIDVNQT